MNIPTIDPNIIGEIPDLHAKRVVSEMIVFLAKIGASVTPALERAISQPIGGNPKAQRKFAERVRATRSPAILDFATYTGKRCKFGLMLSVWSDDEYGGATVYSYFAHADGPGTERRAAGPVWRITHHALTRIVQRTGAHDPVKLLLVMREMGKVVSDAMASARLVAGDGKILYVRFEGGTVILEWPADSSVALVKTVLSPDMAHPLPGLH